MSTVTTFPPAPLWANGETDVSETPRMHVTSGTKGAVGDYGYRTYERLTAEIAKAGWLTGPDSDLGPHSDVTVGLGRTDSDDGRVVGTGVFIALRGDESFYFDAETARKAAAALLEAADVLDGVTK